VQVNVFIVAEGAGRERALTLANELRAAGIAADLDLAERSQKGQMKQADRTGASQALILAEDGAELRDMESGAQRAVELDGIVEELRSAS
jgi:histidyl-tRNA synthetase